MSGEVAVKVYDSPLHRQTRRAWEPVVADGEAYCTEAICLEESRWIPPGAPWHLAHDHSDPSGQTYLGPAHVSCNTSEGATRGNRARRGAVRRWEL